MAKPDFFKRERDKIRIFIACRANFGYNKIMDLFEATGLFEQLKTKAVDLRRFL